MISIHAPLAGCDRNSHNSGGGVFDFNPRTPCGVRPPGKVKAGKREEISIHAPLAGCDPLPCTVSMDIANFNPRTPCGVRPCCTLALHLLMAISIHAPLAGCDLGRKADVVVVLISIHAPLAGCDRRGYPPQRPARHFNPRTPCGVRRRRMHTCTCGRHFNPRTPCGVRLLGICATQKILRNFNPRTPCGVRPTSCERMTTMPKFQSTHPLRGATCPIPQGQSQFSISIHAPLAGCDHLLEGARARREISIHAPLAGCDHGYKGRVQVLLHFNPRTPCGVRPPIKELDALHKEISIHAPLAGCDPS